MFQLSLLISWPWQYGSYQPLLICFIQICGTEGDYVGLILAPSPRLLAPSQMEQFPIILKRL